MINYEENIYYFMFNSVYNTVVQYDLCLDSQMIRLVCFILAPCTSVLARYYIYMYIVIDIINFKINLFRDYHIKTSNGRTMIYIHIFPFIM
jgi:hypothetical protein